MKFSRRIGLFSAFGVLATAIAVSAGGPASSDQHAPAVVAQTSPEAGSCVPQRVPGPLPTPRTVDTWTYPAKGGQPHFFTLNVGQSNSLFYCYTVAGDTRPYVEAPSIRVRAGDTFTMQLVDQIPPSLAGNAPAPQATTPDKCALLPYESPMPSANATPGYFGRPRVAATPSHEMMPNDTNFHTHGWHVDPDVDNVFKSVAMSANGTCTFAFVIPTSQPPGTYWYHAHLHGISASQVGGGLAGALIVLPSGRPDPLPDTTLVIKNFLSSPNGDEHALMMRKYARIRHLPQPKRSPSMRKALAAATFSPFNPPPDVSGIGLNDPNYCNTFSDGFATLQVNGQAIPGVIPGASPSPLPVPYYNQAPGTNRRYRIINASSDSYVNVRIRAGGTYAKLRVLARDGVPVNWGMIPGSTAPFVVRDNVMLGPSNRVDLLVATGARGTQQTIISEAAFGAAPTPVPARNAFPFCLGYSGSPMYERQILTVKSAPVATAQAVQSVGATAARELTTTAADRFVRNVPSVQNRAITFTEYNDEVGYPQGNFYVTETGSSPIPLPSAFSERPFWLLPPRPPVPSPPISFHYLPEITVRKSVTPSEVWTLVNATPEAHTFHIHQLTFVAVVSPWEPTAGHESVFLDSIALPAAAEVAASQCGGRSPCLQPSITRIKINFGPIHRGTFVYHCHMLFHEDAGMMGVIQVI